MANPIKRMLLGRAMNSGSLAETLLPKRLALPVFCSDPLSSVAHATEQILLVDYVLTVAVSVTAAGRG